MNNNEILEWAYVILMSDLSLRWKALVTSRNNRLLYYHAENNLYVFKDRVDNAIYFVKATSLNVAVEELKNRFVGREDENDSRRND